MKSRTVLIHRDYRDPEDRASLGICYVIDENLDVIFKSESLERGWKDNKSDVSCVPEGTYPLRLEYSPRFKQDLWELKNVPGRSECKFHSANYWKQLNGCIALGKDRKDIDYDNVPDVTSSKDTMEDFHKAMEGVTESKVVIINVYGKVYF